MYKLVTHTFLKNLIDNEDDDILLFLLSDDTNFLLNVKVQFYIYVIIVIRLFIQKSKSFM